jgi:hypothetical protein
MVSSKFHSGYFQSSTVILVCNKEKRFQALGLTVNFNSIAAKRRLCGNCGNRGVENYLTQRIYSLSVWN